VKLRQFGTQFIRNTGETLRVGEDRPDLAFHEGWYLFMANTDEGVATMRENHQVHLACGADRVLWTQDEFRAAFPHIRCDDILLASYGRSGEGWFNNTGLMNAFRAKARALGADYVVDEVVGIGRSGPRVTSVSLKSGRTIETGVVVNASGPRANVTANMAGLHIPVEPRKRMEEMNTSETPGLDVLQWERW
jgi:glycine/D-amino acid oxidase-like deaminating enzyme